MTGCGAGVGRDVATSGGQDGVFGGTDHECCRDQNSLCGGRKKEMITSCDFLRLLVVYENIDNGMDFLSLAKTAGLEISKIVKNNCEYHAAPVMICHVCH